ncbi:L-lysine dehydrogenase [Caenispirillum salinarum AK4]|uniref:L-lysine dehydrogenase n=1 Tax=Caenispirillum salinarum AK4 TaxID=1238182 RepID=K9HSM2_9PROT|nr:saccharopine dehydrogenase family protein [Caenispirillum salinarum]EKV31331.1 L-lysine dehydrogenase [Caenispirillum salinarum AK4]
MRDILVLGGGKIGETICDFLAGSGDYRVTVGDRHQSILDRLPRREAVRKQVVDATDPVGLRDAMKGHYAVISALPYDLTVTVAEAARDAGVHYLDLTEDVASTRAVKKLAEGAETAFIPQSGLAPGFISIVTHDLCRRFDELDTVGMRVGALPKYPTNALNYNLTWSTEGVINEYLEPCDAIVNGRAVQVPPLEEREEFSLDGMTYEAFNTSGGLGTLCETLAGNVRAMNYKSVRYPGHRDIMKALLHDLRLGDRRHVLKDILEHAIPGTMQDVILVFVTVSGRKNGRLMQECYANKIYGREIAGVTYSGIQTVTASGVCAVLDLLAAGRIAQKGFVKQEDIALPDFLANRFGMTFAREEDLAAEVRVAAE